MSSGPREDLRGILLSRHSVGGQSAMGRTGQADAGHKCMSERPQRSGGWGSGFLGIL